MKVLLIHNYYKKWSGEDTYFTNLIQLLKNKHEIDTFTRSNASIRTFKDKMTTALGLFINMGIYKELDAKIKSFKPGIVQIQNIYPLITPIVYWVCKKNKVPIVQRFSNYRFICPSGYLFRNGKICELCIKKRFTFPAIIYGCYHQSKISSFFFALSLYFHRHILHSFDLIDRFIFPAKFIHKYFLALNIIPKSKTVIMPTFTTKERLMKQKQIFKDYYIYVGQLVEEKGVYQLLNLFINEPKLNLIVIGDNNNPLYTKYAGYNNIRFLGFKTKQIVLSYIKHARATILPSLWYDVLPNVLIESFSVGTPVIAAKIGVFNELIVHNKTGILFDYKNMSQLKTYLLKFKKTTEIIHAVKQIANKKYSQQKRYSLLLKMYEGIINKNH